MTALFRVLVAMLAWQFFPLCGRAVAATLTWTGAAGDNNVSNRLNWSPAQAPVAGDTLSFAGATGLAPQLAANLAVGSISFGSTAQAFVLGGAGIYTVNSGGVTNSSTQVETISNGIVLGASQGWNAAAGSLVFGGAVNLQTFTLTVSGAQGTVITGVISGTGALVQNGPGTLQLGGTAANTYTGMTTVNGGELDLNKTANVIAVAGNLTIGDGIGGANSDIVKLLAAGQISPASAVLINGTSGKLDLNGFAQTIGSLADTGTVTAGGSSVNLGAGTLTAGNATSTIFSGAITGTGSLVKQGAGTLALAGTNTFTGTVTVSAGTLQLNASAAFPAAGNLMMLGGTLDIRGTSPVLGSITFGNGTAATATGVEDSGTTPGFITLNGSVLFNGTAAHTTPPGLVSANVQLSPGVHSINNPNSNYSSATNYDIIFSSPISGSGGISKDGPSTSFWIAFNAKNTYTGVTNVTAGNLYLGVVNSLPQFSAVTVSTGASLILNPPVTQFGVTAGSYSQSIGSLAGGGNVTLGSATLTSGNDGTTTSFTGVISGTGGFAKVGAGVQTLGGTNSYTGTTVISGGKVNITGTLGATAVTVAGGGSLGGAGNGTSNGIVGVTTSATGGTVTVAGGTTAVTRGAIDLTDGAIGTFTIRGNSTGAGSVTLTLGGAAGSSSALNFDIGASTTDKLAVLQKAQLNAGGAIINLNPLAGTVLVPGTYPLITFAGDTLTGSYSLGSLTGNGGYSYALSHTATAENLVVLPIATPAAAYWNGGQGTQWNTFGAGTNLTNWCTTAAGTANTNQIPGATTDVFFSVSSGAANLASTLGANFSVKSLNFTATGGSAVIGGANSLTLGTGGIISAPGAGAQTIATPVVLGAAQTWTNNGGLITLGGATISGTGISLTTAGTGNFAIAAVLQTGAGSLTQTGSGTVTLSGTNTHTGGITIRNGTVVLDSNNAAGSGTITVGDTAGTAPASLLFSANAGRTVPNLITVPAGSTGMRTIGGQNTTGTNAFSGAVSLGAGVTLTEPAGGTMNLTGVLSGAGGITKTGAGTIRLSSTNTFTGPVLVSAGTILYGGNNALGTGSLTVNGGALDMSAGRTDSVGAVTLENGSILGTGGSTLTSTSGFTVRNGTVSAVLAGAVGLVKDTAGSVTLSAANTFTGATNVNAGTLTYAVSNALATGAVTVTSATLDMGTGFTDSVGAVTLVSGSILGGAGSVLTSTSGFTVQSGTVTAGFGGAVALTKSTTGTVLVSGANTYTGTTTISAGTLRLGATETLPNASAVTIAAGATLDMNNFSDTVGSLAGAGSLLLCTGTLTSGGSNTSTTFTGTAGGSGGLTKTGTGTLTLGGVDSYSGDTTVNAGTLTLGNAAASPSASRVTVAGGAVFNVAGFSAAIGSLAGAGSVTLGAGTLTAGGDTTTSAFSGVVSGAGGFTKAGTGVLTMTGGNTFGGALNINAGSVILSGATGAFANAGSISIRTGASLVLDNSVTENANRISNTAAINIQGGNLQMNSDANGTAESVGQLNFLLGPANITVAHNGTAAQASSLTFGSLGSTVTGVTLNFAGTGLGGVLGAGATGPHVFITGQPNGLIGGWARVGTDFADYQAFGVVAFSAYYTGGLGVNVNDPSTIVKLGSTSVAAAYTLTNAGTTTDGGLLVSDLALVDLGPATTRTLNLLAGGLIKKSAPDSAISGAGRLTAGGTAAGALQIAVETGRTLTIASAIIDNAGTDGVYGNAGDGVVSIVKSDLGTLVLGGSNTFSGNVYLNEGTLAVGADSALGAAANDVFLSGGTLAITAGFTPNTGRRFVVTAGLTGAMDVAAGQALTITGAGDLLATGNAASTLVKTGAGDLILGAANPNFTGTARIVAGAVEMRNTGALGTGGITLAGGTLRLRSDTSATFGNALTLAADSTIAASPLTSGSPVISIGAISIGAQVLSLTSSGGATLNVAGANLTGSATFNTTGGTTTMGAISGAYGFAKTGAGTLQLSTPGTYSGVTDVQAGTLRLANATAIPAASNVNVGAAGTADLNGLNVGLGSITGSGAITLGGGTLTVGGNGLASNFAGSISGPGGLVKAAGETLTLSGASTYAGPTGINAGVLVIGANNALPTGTAVGIAAGAGLDLGGFGLRVAGITGTGTLAIGTGALIVGDNTNATFAGTITGTGTLTKVGGGTWSLAGNSPFTGVVTVAGGVIEVLANNAIGDPVVMAGAQITLAPGVTVSTEPLTLAGMGSDGNGALQVPVGAATWAGSILLSADAGTGAGAGATLTLGDALDLSGHGLTVGGAGDTIAMGVVSGAGMLVKTGTGTLTLRSANTFTGATIVAAGTLVIADGGALGAAGAFSGTEVRNGATLDLENPAGMDIGFESLSLAGSGVSGTGAIQVASGDNFSSGPVTLTADTSVNVGTGASLSLTGGIGESGAGRSLAKNGAGTLILGGADTFTGTLAVNGGTVALANDNTLNGHPGVTLSSTGTLDLRGFSDRLGSLSGSGTVTFGAASTGDSSLAVGSNGANTTFSGVITGGGSLEKVGTGALILGSASSYTGTTTITAGTLVAGNDLAFGAVTQPVILNGGALASNSDARTLANPITVNPVAGNQITGGSNLTLTGGAAGTGTLAVNLSSNAKTVTVNPATADSFAPGMLRLNSGTLILGGSNRIGDTTGITFAGGRLNTAGFSDQLGAMVLASDSTLDFGTSDTVRLIFSSATWTGGVLDVVNWTGAANTTGNADQFLVMSAGQVDATFLSEISFDGYGRGAIAFSVGGGLYEIVPVPEPGTVFGAAALIAFAGWRERRRIAGAFRNAAGRSRGR